MRNISINITAKGVALLVGIVAFALFFAGNYPDITIRAANSASVDAFGRFRVSQATTLFDTQNEYGHGDLYWNHDFTSTADTNWTIGEPVVDLTVPTTYNARAIRQTKEYFRYQSGTSLLIVMTVNAKSYPGLIAKGGSFKQWGYGDSLNGIFFRTQGDTLSVVKRSNSTGAIIDSVVRRALWNVDTLGATTASGYVPKLWKSQIWWIDMAWLGVSRVRMGVIDDKGNYVVVHQFQNANVTDGVYLRNANLPIRFEIRNTAGLADTLRTICATVKSEAEDQNTFGVNQAISLGVAGKTKTTIYTPLISIRMDTTSFNSLPNRISLRDLGITLSCATSVTQWALVYNATLTAPTWNAMPTYAGQTMTRVSGMVFDTVASAYTGGVILAQGYVAAGGVGGSATSGAASQTVLSKVPLHTGIKGNVGVPLTLVVRGVTAAPTAVVGGFNWREIY